MSAVLGKTECFIMYFLLNILIEKLGQVNAFDATVVDLPFLVHCFVYLLNLNACTKKKKKGKKLNLGAADLLSPLVRKICAIF